MWLKYPKIRFTFLAHYIIFTILFTDYEYCSYNYRGFDMANHFLEWTYDYTNPEYPFFYELPNNYPTREQQVTIL